MNVSAAGHVIPTFGLVAELSRRGEEIIYYEIPRFQGEIEAFGATFRSYPPLNPKNAPPTNNELSLIPNLTWVAREWLPALLEFLQADRPDYIVHDSLCLWGRLAGELLKIPAVNSIATVAFTASSFYECPLLRQKLPRLLKEVQPGMECYRRDARYLRRTYGLPPIKPLDTFTNPESLNICYLPREIQPYADKFGDRYHFVGPCNPVRAMEYDFPLEKLAGVRVIYISFGTIHDPGIDFFKSCLAALCELEVRVVMLLSPGIAIEALGEIPDNFIVRPTGTVPQLEILKRADLFIMHGAAGGTRESIWYGVPAIAVPQTYEQEILSRRLEAQGAGVTILPEEVTPAQLQATARRIIETPAFRSNSTLLGDACRRAGGVAAAVDSIAAYLLSIKR